MDEEWRENLRFALKKKSITGVELCKRIGHPPNYISGLLTKGGCPNLRTMIKIANALETPIEEVFFRANVISESEQIARDFSKLTSQQKQAVRIIISTLREANVKNESNF
ncbi:MAG: helix-turn-helix transcriptional regulator [Pseudomonadota bacterium]|nr:helix-turn-helix transcriptional regulator [Pseudomonadota bacterium]